MTRPSALIARTKPGKPRIVARYSIASGLKGPRGKTPDEVVLPFGDFETMRDALEDQLDLAEARAIVACTKPEEWIPIEVVEAERAGMSTLRAWRKARGLTLTALAERAGLSQPYLSELERGLKEASAGALKRLAKALGTVPGNLI